MPPRLVDRAQDLAAILGRILGMKFFWGLAILAVALVGCGGGTSGQQVESTRSDEVGSSSSVARQVQRQLPPGCAPGEVADLFSGLAQAVSEHDRDQVLGYLAKGDGFLEITIYHGKEPGAGRVDSHAPAGAYHNFINTFGAVEKPVLLGTEIGPVAPFVWLRKGAEGDDPMAGAEVAIRLGARAMTGKIGIDCATGTVFVGAMSARPGLRPQKMCGQILKMAADRPLICALPS